MSEIYIAGKIASEKTSIPEFAEELEYRGHEIPYKWWEYGRLPKPYLDFPETNALPAVEMIDAAVNSDVFLLFPEDKIMGAMAELSAAIVSAKTKPDKEIIIINPFEFRQSVFYVHPSVICVRGLSEVRQRNWF